MLLKACILYGCHYLKELNMVLKFYEKIFIFTSRLNQFGLFSAHGKVFCFCFILQSSIFVLLTQDNREFNVISVSQRCLREREAIYYIHYTVT